MALSFVFAFLFLYNANSQCGPWTATNPDDGSTVTLDLSCLTGNSFDAVDSESPPHHYHWSMCGNGESCNDDNVMVAQRVPGDDSTCYTVGRWDFTKQPEYENLNGGTWTFIYDNGDDDCGNPARTWSPKFVCSPGTNAAIGSVDEIPNSCFYEIEIKTQYACGGTYDCIDTGGDSGLSGGWIFVIVFFGAIFLYCVVGYLITGLTVNKANGLGDFGNNIPNRTLWSHLPSLVIAGCMFSKDFMMGLVNKGGGDMNEPIVETGGDE